MSDEKKRPVNGSVNFELSFPGEWPVGVGYYVRRIEQPPKEHEGLVVVAAYQVIFVLSPFAGETESPSPSTPPTGKPSP